MRRCWKAFALVLLLLLALAPTVHADSPQDRIDEISGQLSSLDAEKARLQDRINTAKTKREQELVGKVAVEQQISITQTEISLLEQRVSLLEETMAETRERIELLKEAITVKQQTYDDHYQDYLARLRSMQLYDEGTVLTVLLGVDSYTDFLTAGELLSRVAGYDRELMESIQAQRRELEKDRNELALELEGLAASKALAEQDKLAILEKKNLLTRQQREIEDRIQDIDRMEVEYLADLENNRRLREQMQAELDDLYDQIKWSDSAYVEGEMQWPVPGYREIFSQYGLRFQSTDFHKGIDISGGGILGKEVLAANDGTVSHTNWTYVQGSGYGIFIMIDHGGGISTLYAHLSNIQVQTGEQVKKGQVIGNVGNTGWSTGPHLHFEVRENKNAVDPLPYVSSTR